MKKKLLSLFLSMLFVFSFGACGKSESKEKCEVCTYGEWTTKKEATCLTTGTDVRICTVCGDKETRTTTTNNHTSSHGKCIHCGEITSARDVYAHYVSNEGKYYLDGEFYLLVLGSYLIDDISYSFVTCYYPNTDEITFTIYLDDLFSLKIYLTPTNGSDYVMMYTPTSTREYYLVGPFYPSTFSSSTTSLSATSTNITDSDMYADLKEFGASMANFMLTRLDSTIADSGVTAYDLGFKNF